MSPFKGQDQQSKCRKMPCTYRIQATFDSIWLPIKITMKMMNIIMILVIIIIKKDILVEHELFSTIPSIEPNPHYVDSQEP